MVHSKQLNIFFQYWLAVFLLSITGIAACLYSAHGHYKNYTDPLYSSFCAISQAINCDTVAQSPWSIILGIPVAWWGLLFYLSFLVLLLTANYRSLKAWQGLFYTALASSIVTLGLAGIAVWKIKSLCIVCLTIYAITFALTYTCWIGKRRAQEAEKNKDNEQLADQLHGQVGDKGFLRSYGPPASVFLVCLAALYLFLPRYWDISSSSIDISTLPQGVTEEQHPWIGAETPQITITQFSDYQCFQCGKMYFLLLQLVAAHPDSLRLVHRHFPMDSKVNSVLVQDPFHEGSGDLAKVAILSALRGKFWQMNELLYILARNKVTEIPIKELADSTGLDPKELAASLTHPTTQELLRRDIWRGMKLGITGTPAFVIEGEVYQGNIPPEILKKIMELPGKDK